MPSPLVTIVTPIYQGAACVAACVESVRAQDYENWIHILVDNRSTDGTEELLRGLA
jgi:teichuronic acid biosynthesis glycosyltransferase TuaG